MPGDIGKHAIDRRGLAVDSLGDGCDQQRRQGDYVTTIRYKGTDQPDLYEVTATVRWGQGDEQYQVQLTTLVVDLYGSVTGSAGAVDIPPPR